MISIEEAVKLILDDMTPLPAELVPLDDALGRVTAEAVRSPWNLPPQDNSAMDGYAFLHAAATAGGAFRVVEEIAAGHPSGRVVGAGEAAKIMTGAPLPEGTDTVIPVEDTERDGDTVRFARLLSKGANVRYAGEDVRQGDEVIPQGARVRPAEVAMLASLGKSMVRVHQRPRVAVLSTGDEIVELGEFPGRGKIVNSNAHALAAQLREAGGEPVLLGIGRDDPEGLLEMLERARGADMVLTTGGVSMGDYDYVPEVLQRWGVEIAFAKVSMKPGKPVVYGKRRGVPVFGLPGNPVSAMVAFEQFVRPALRKLTGATRLFRPVFEAEIAPEAGDLVSKGGRLEFVRCRVERTSAGYRVVRIKARSSGMLSTLLDANALAIVPQNSPTLRAGDRVKVQIVDGEFLEGAALGW